MYVYNEYDRFDSGYPGSDDSNAWEDNSERGWDPRVWKKYEKDIPFLPSPRPRPLTPSEVPGGEGKRPVAAFQKSPWFKLPPTLRQDILRLAFGNEVIHVGMEFDLYDALGRAFFPGEKPPIWGWIGLECDRDMLAAISPPRRGRIPHLGPWDNSCLCIDYAQESEFRSVEVLGWLMSCRQNYAETIDLLYSANTISLNGQATIYHLPRLLVPERLAVITSLEVKWEIEKDTVLEPVFTLLSEARFPNLKRLFVSAEEGDTSYSVIEAILPQIDGFVKSRPGIEECAFAIAGELFDSLGLKDKDDESSTSDVNSTNSEADEPYDFDSPTASPSTESYWQDYGARVRSYGIPLYDPMNDDKTPVWRSLNGNIHDNRIPYTDSFPKPPFHLRGDERVGYWLLLVGE
ncbi:hypothetical protein ACHAQD_011986 [Fusarium lateritium]